MNEPKSELGRLLLRLVQCAANTDPNAFQDIRVDAAILEADVLATPTPPETRSPTEPK